MKLRYLILIASSCLLTGCLSPVKTDPPKSYMIDGVPKHVPVSKKRSMVMMVLPPDSRPIYQTRRMAYTVKPYQIEYFGENEWAERPTQMLQPLLVQTLQNTKHYRGVVTQPYTGQYNYTLQTQILRFEQNYLSQPATFKLIAETSINRTATNRLVAAKQFSISVPLPEKTPYGGVLAANIAVKRLLAEIAKFTTRYA